MEKTKLTINLGLKLVIWGIPLGLTLRLIQMGAFFDYETGFYIGAGELLAWLSLLLPVIMAAIGEICFKKNARAFKAREHVIARGPGIFAGFSGGVLLVMGAFMLKDYMSFRVYGINEFESTTGGWMHLLAAVMSIITGILQSVLALRLMQGRDRFEKVPLLYLPAVLWGMCLLVIVYVYHAKFASLVENLFSMFSTVCLLMSLLGICRVLAGVKEPEALRSLFLWGSFTAVLEIPYDLSNTARALMGSTYFGELPAVYALGRLAMGMFVLAFMLSAYRTGVDKGLDGVPGEARHLGE